jgi:hypothetical protein
MGWGDVRYCFAMAILVLTIIFPHIFVRSISRRYLDQTLWNLVGINFVKLEVNLILFAPWFPWHGPPFWTCSQLQQLTHTTVDIPTKFHEVWWKVTIQNYFKSPFFVSMAIAAKFVQPIPIFLAYLVPLEVDGFPIKFHQFICHVKLCC